MQDSYPQAAAHRMGDMTKPQTLGAAMKGMDAAVNLVGAVRLADPAAYFALHEAGARQVVRACRRLMPAHPVLCNDTAGFAVAM